VEVVDAVVVAAVSEVEGVDTDERAVLLAREVDRLLEMVDVPLTEPGLLVVSEGPPAPPCIE
jgi:hypothetical protein